MDPVWQRLWLRCQQHDWQSLAFIGSSKRDPDGVLEIAHGMARLASEEQTAAAPVTSPFGAGSNRLVSLTAHAASVTTSRLHPI